MKLTAPHLYEYYLQYLISPCRAIYFQVGTPENETDGTYTEDDTAYL